MPGHTEDSVRETPILEAYLAGIRFRKALPTLIREAAGGRVRPDELEDFLAREELSLAAAEEWLERATVVEPGLAAWLDSLTPEWVLDELVASGGKLGERVADAGSEKIATLLDYLYRQTGLDDAFLGFFLGQPPPYELGRIREAFAAWLMCVEYVHDLTRPPHLEALQPLGSLAATLRDTSVRLVAHLRDRDANAYAGLANAAEGRLEEELEAMRPEDLGKIDTFRGEEIRVLEGAAKALAAGDWTAASNWAAARLDSRSFWLQRDPGRRMAWRLLADAAELGHALDREPRPLAGAESLAEALERYTASAFEVDRAHRRFEQRRLKLLRSSLPHFAELYQAAEDLRRRYRRWADRLARDFAALCERQGFLPEAELQQRTIYDQVVHPLVQGEARVAFFLVDALRYEMATELLDGFQGPGRSVRLAGRYAELPTLTGVGMNALAPVSQAGKLTLASGKDFSGFKTASSLSAVLTTVCAPWVCAASTPPPLPARRPGCCAWERCASGPSKVSSAAAAAPS